MGGQYRGCDMRDNFDIVIFGGDGDLALRKLLPALYRCEREAQLSADGRIFLTTQHQAPSEENLLALLEKVKSYLDPNEVEAGYWQTFTGRITLSPLDLSEFDDRWQVFGTQLNKQPNFPRMFYMAIPPSLYGKACQYLNAAELITPASRVILEKPIGYDVQSARDINSQVAEYFAEENIYRIDHYLGKETVQNLLALRFTNVLFEHVWDNKAIDNIQITLSETVGLETRAAFYDRAGALRDMVQNHLLQLLSFIAMDPPNEMTADSIRNEKLKVMQALRPIAESDVEKCVVRGQYHSGEMAGSVVPGYLDELGNNQSHTETYVAIRAYIDNWRWAGVPFYLRTGKRMQERFAEIVIEFKPVSHRAYPKTAGELAPNRLIIRLQPEESIEMTLMTKVLHNNKFELKPVSLNLDYSQEYEDFIPDAYKRLLMDVSDGNSSLFAHRDEVEQAWTWLDPIMNSWAKNPAPPEPYAAGSWGPASAEQLLAEKDHRWFL